MSKRAGVFVTLREVVEEVGSSAVRFYMLTARTSAVRFRPRQSDRAEPRESGFLVQYGHARGASIFRNAKAEIPALAADGATDLAALKGADLARLNDAGELTILRKLASYPRLIEAAAVAHEPHRVAFYLYELASEFHSNRTRGGKESPHLRSLSEMTHK